MIIDLFVKGNNMAEWRGEYQHEKNVVDYFCPNTRRINNFSLNEKIAEIRHLVFKPKNRESFL